jgi:hypothetical protein
MDVPAVDHLLAALLALPDTLFEGDVPQPPLAEALIFVIEHLRYYHSETIDMPDSLCQSEINLFNKLQDGWAEMWELTAAMRRDD